MLKAYLKSAATLLLVAYLTSAVFASGKMEVPLGEQVTLQAETLQSGGTYKWVTTKGRDILNTQSGNYYSYTFDSQGEYEVNLTVTDKAGATKTTVVDILVGNRYSAPSGSGSTDTGSFADVPLEISVDTLPTISSEKTVYIAGDEGRVVFDMSTRPDILEYRIDRNVYVDSDGDGIANNDVDNSDHSSYLLGGIWQTKYYASESSRIAAEVTVVNALGKKAKTQVEVLFASSPAKEGKVVAILDTLPALDPDDKNIYVYGDKDTVAFYSKRSQGDIVEYRIDRNIFDDSDGDGNPANDIDNRTDTSFKTGDVWLAEYEKTDQQIIAQLITVGSGGTGSRIQREIIFTDAPVIEIPETPGQTEDTIQLTADKEFVQKGDTVLFMVKGLSQDLENYTFDWDFNGDGEVDQTVEGDNTVTYIYDTAAIQPVGVRVMDTGGNEATFKLDFLVKDIAVTKADFDYETDGLTVDFTNLSEVSQDLANKSLQYTWSFGDTDPDNYDAQRDKIGVENPTYVYKMPGNYIVSLTVVDSEQVTDTKTTEIILEAPEGYVPDGSVSEEAEDIIRPEKSGSLIGTIFKIVLYIILIVIILIAVIIVGLMVFLKIQNPDLVFEELVDELKIKLLAMMGVHDMIEPVPSAKGATQTAPEATPMPKAAPAPETSAPSVEEEAPVPEPDLSKADAPMPDWLKPGGASPKPETPAPQADVIEGEVEEEVPVPAPEAPASETPAKKPEGGDQDLNKSDGPVPDWLK